MASSDTIAFTGVVTKSEPEFGMVRDDVFFVKSVVKGPFPKVGDRVLVQAEKVHGMPFQYVAKRLQRLVSDVAQTSEVVVKKPIAPPPPKISAPAATTLQPNLPKHIVEQFFPVFSSLVMPNQPMQQPVEESSSLTSEYEAFEAAINSKDAVQKNNFTADAYNCNSNYGYYEEFPVSNERQAGVHHRHENRQRDQVSGNSEDSWKISNGRYSEPLIHHAKKIPDLNTSSTESPRSRRLERSMAKLHSQDGEKQCFYCNSTKHKARYCTENPETNSKTPQRERNEKGRSQRLRDEQEANGNKRTNADHDEDTQKRRESVLHEEKLFQGTTLKATEFTKQQKLKLSRLYCNKFGQEQCFICGSTGHKVKKCPKAPEKPHERSKQDIRTFREKDYEDSKSKRTKEPSASKRKEKVDSIMKEISRLEDLMYPKNSIDLEKAELSLQPEKERKKKHSPLKSLPAKKDPQDNEKILKINKLLGKWRLRTLPLPTSQSSNSKSETQISLDKDLFCLKCQKSGHVENFCLSERIAKHFVSAEESSSHSKKAISSSPNQIQTPNKNEKSSAPSNKVSDIPLPDSTVISAENHPASQKGLIKCTKCQKAGHIEKFCLFDRIAKLSTPVEKPIVNNSQKMPSSLNKNNIHRRFQENSSAFKNAWSKSEWNSQLATVPPPPIVLDTPKETLVFCSKCNKTGHIEKHCISEQWKRHEKSVPSVFTAPPIMHNILGGPKTQTTIAKATEAPAISSKTIANISQNPSTPITKIQDVGKIENPTKETVPLNSVPKNPLVSEEEKSKSLYHMWLQKRPLSASQISNQNKEKEKISTHVNPLYGPPPGDCDIKTKNNSLPLPGDFVFKIPHPVKNQSPTKASIGSLPSSPSVGQNQNVQVKLPSESKNVLEEQNLAPLSNDVPQTESKTTEDSASGKILNPPQLQKTPQQVEIIEIPNKEPETGKSITGNSTLSTISTSQSKTTINSPPTVTSPSQNNSTSTGQIQNVVETPEELTTLNKTSGSGLQTSTSVPKINQIPKNDGPGSKFQKTGGLGRRRRSVELVLIDSPYITPGSRNENPTDFKRSRLDTEPQQMPQTERASDTYRTPQGGSAKTCYKCQKVGHIAKYCSSQNVVNPEIKNLMGINISGQKPEKSNSHEDAVRDTEEDHSGQFNDQRKNYKTLLWESELPTSAAPQTKCEGCVARMLGGPPRNHRSNCLLGENPRFKDNGQRRQDGPIQIERDNSDANYFNNRDTLEDEEHLSYNNRHDSNYEENYNFRGRNDTRNFNPNSNAWPEENPLDSGRRSPILLIARNKEDIPTAQRQNRKLIQPWRRESHFPDSFDTPIDFHHRPPSFQGGFYEEPEDFHEPLGHHSDFHNERHYPEYAAYHQERVGPPICSHCHKLGHVLDDCRHFMGRRKHIVTL